MPNAGPRSITNEEPSSGRVQQRSGHRPTRGRTRTTSSTTACTGCTRVTTGMRAVGTTGHGEWSGLPMCRCSFCACRCAITASRRLTFMAGAPMPPRTGASTGDVNGNSVVVHGTNGTTTQRRHLRRCPCTTAITRATAIQARKSNSIRSGQRSTAISPRTRSPSSTFSSKASRATLAPSRGKSHPRNNCHLPASSRHRRTRNDRRCSLDRRRQAHTLNPRRRRRDRTARIPGQTSARRRSNTHRLSGNRPSPGRRPRKRLLNPSHRTRGGKRRGNRMERIRMARTRLPVPDRPRLLPPATQRRGQPDSLRADGNLNSIRLEVLVDQVPRQTSAS